MTYNPQNPNGQATSANSAPVVIASDQSAVSVSVSTGSLTATIPGGVTINTGSLTATVANIASLAVARMFDSSGASLSATAAGNLNVNLSSSSLSSINVAVTTGSLTATIPSGSSVITTQANGASLNANVYPTALSTTTGATAYFTNSLSTTVLTVKGSAGNMYNMTAINQNTVDAYIQFYDTGSPSVGTTAPTYSFLVPAGVASTIAGGFSEQWVVPLTFSTNIKIAATTTATGSSAPSTNIVVNIGYK